VEVARVVRPQEVAAIEYGLLALHGAPDSSSH
jgi:hypothetical protein